MSLQEDNSQHTYGNLNTINTPPPLLEGHAKISPTESAYYSALPEVNVCCCPRIGAADDDDEQRQHTSTKMTKERS